MSRIAARTAAFERIYQDMMNRDASEPEADFCTVVAGEDARYAEFLVRGVAARREALTETLTRVAVGFGPDRIFKVDLAILLLAAYEIVYRDEIAAAFPDSAPNKAISCNEAVNLAKKYSTIKSPGFINGVLSKIN